MLKIAPARRLPGSLRLRIVSIIILIALISPIASFDGWLIAEASGPQGPYRAAPVNAAQPEPFTIPGAGWSLRASLLGALFSITAPEAKTEPRNQPDVSGLDLVGKRRVDLPDLADAGPLGEAAPAPPPPAPVDFDFDGDGRTDISRWHPQTAEYKIHNSNGGSYSTWTVGSAGERPAPADYDGDGKTDAATFSAGTWKIRKSSDGTTTTVSSFGQAGDIPVSGNYLGASTSAEELAVYRPSNGGWYWREMGSSTIYSMGFGSSTDIPAPGDYDGDGLSDPAVYRPSTGEWWMWQTSAGSYSMLTWGNEMDVPVAADFDGDGKTDPTVFRAYEGAWFALHSSTGYTTYTPVAYGNYGDQPVAGYFDADAKADFAVWRPTSGRWYILRSTDLVTEMENLGVPGDTAVPSSYIYQFGAQIAPDVVNKERLAPRNATGETDLYSQNFSWGRNLVSLPGRSGMDLDIGVSYNSLVWTKVGGAMLFDADANSDVVSAGFRVEPAPVIEPAYYDDETDRFNYLMVAPDGSRLEFRQTGVSNIYETHDSSYAQLVTTGASSPLDPVEDISVAVTTADGTRSDYDWIAGAFRCTKKTDRNGNYISIGYDGFGFGLVTAVTDTLGRVVDFNYDSEQNLSTVTQTWKGDNGSGSNVTHTYATFAYTTKTLATDFDGLTVYGPPSGTVLKVLDKITYADGSSTKFHHNGYAQVWKIENIAADSSTHVLNHVRTNLESPSADQTDCPRFSQVWNYVENFNSGTEVASTITRTTGQEYDSPAGVNDIDATKIEVAMSGHPDNLVSKTWYHESNDWKNGLAFASEDWADGTGGSELKRWTLNTFTQDNTGASYTINPRVTETKVGDGTNTKRTTVDYVLYDSSTIAAFGLPATVKVYDADQTTVLKQIDTAYNFDVNYISRRIAGLPFEVVVQGLNQLTNSMELVSRVTYGYDEGGFTDSSLQQNISPDVGHDNSNFGSSFAYRGNLTSATRWDVTAPTNGSAAITTATLKYNTAGSLVAKITAWDGTNTRTVRIGYSDNWNSTGNPATYAYPTVITDPAGSSLAASGHTSTVKYRYDIGANVEATSPAPAGNTYGKTTKRVFDSVGRLVRDSVFIDTTEHSYARYEYPSNGIQSKTYATIVDQNGNGNIAEDEVYSESWWDGAGRVRMSRTEHPGSDGGWASTLTEYDILGRVKRRSVPTETDSSYDPAGDDASRGYLWTHQKYDWMGRVVRKINTDGVDSPTLNDSDVLVSYDGCGCAGGLVTTIQGESVPRDDQPMQNARRTQKLYADILGRQWKAVDYNWDGTTPYTTTEQFYNGRDQIVRTRQIDNTSTTTPQTYRDVTMTYDGHGRLKTRHLPIEDANTETTWNYNPDDSVAQVIDPRGVVTDLTYNVQGLTAQVAYAPPYGSTIPDTPTSTFAYDNLGNRTSMDTAGVSATTYTYDSLSRMTSETVDFDDLASDYTVTYTYQPSGVLRSVTDPFGAVVNHVADKTGRTTSVTGSGFASVATYASGIKYRAFGAVKEMTHGTTVSSVTTYTYNDRLKPVTYRATKDTGYVRRADYEYFADGRAKDVNNLQDGRFDQAYEYDHLGRLRSSVSGLVTNSEDAEVPAYSQSIGYNGFGDMTTRSASVWGGDSTSFSNTYLNGRKQGGDEVFDAVGNIVDKTIDSLNYSRWTFDASGALTGYERAYETHDGTGYDITNSLEQKRDGDGRYVERHSERDIVHAFPSQSSHTEEHSYFVNSTILGGRVLTEVDQTGTKVSTKVYVGGAEIAEQRAATNVVAWKHRDAVTGSVSSIKADGFSYWGGENDSDFNAEIEPLGAAIPNSDPYPNGTGDPDTEPMPTKFKLNGSVFSAEHGCMVNYARTSCTQMTDLAQSWGKKVLGGFIWTETPFLEYGLLDNEDRLGNILAENLHEDGISWRMFGNQVGILIGAGVDRDLVPVPQSSAAPRAEPELELRSPKRGPSSQEESDESCTVSVMRTRVGSSSGSGSTGHLFITTEHHVQSEGLSSTRAYRAGPANATPFNRNSFGKIIAIQGRYDSYFPDFPKEPDDRWTTMYSRIFPGNCTQFDASFQKTTDWVNLSLVDYGLHFPNSNSFVYTALKRAGFDVDSMTNINVIGWGYTLKLKRDKEPVLSYPR